MGTLKVGVLAFHGDVIEHIEATQKAADKLKLKVEIIQVRTKKDLHGLHALIIPGGESTTLQKLCEREGMFADMKKIRNIFGTCAGAIMLAKKIHNTEKGQKTLGLMDIEIDRNAYGRQTESFEERIKTRFGDINAVFIRAPRIVKIGRGVSILAVRPRSPQAENEEILACEQTRNGRHYIAACFHPELTTTLFHEYFLQMIQKSF